MLNSNFYTLHYFIFKKVFKKYCFFLNFELFKLLLYFFYEHLRKEIAFFNWGIE